MIARKNPVRAPRNASVIERLLKVRSPWPVRRNPVYAIATVQRIMRTGYMGNHLLMSKYCHNPVKGKEINWCARRDSNSRPTAPEAAALSRLSYGRVLQVYIVGVECLNGRHAMASP